MFTRWLKFHDTYIQPIIDNPVCDTVNTFFSFFWFIMVLAPYFIVKRLDPAGWIKRPKKVSLINRDERGHP
jgi:hypothetical protein